ncbi:MAG: hypothetical protein ACLSG9_09420 [Eubacterium sp.]
MSTKTQVSGIASCACRYFCVFVIAKALTEHKLFYERLELKKRFQKACKTLEDYAILVAKIREYAREMDDLSMAVHKAIQYCIDHDHLRDFLILNQAEVAAMSLLEGSWEEYADSMDQELERLKASEKALKKEVLEKDAELERVSRKKDEKLQAQAAKIKELEALLASKQ